jgi:hypothetical protein
MATIDKMLGAKPDIQFPDFTGRPHSLLSEREPIQELLG